MPSAVRPKQDFTPSMCVSCSCIPKSVLTRTISSTALEKEARESGTKRCCGVKTTPGECWSWCTARLRSRRQAAADSNSSSFAAESNYTARYHVLLETHHRAVWYSREVQSLTRPPIRGSLRFGLDSRLPSGLMASQALDLLNREITPNDYELLLQLDEANVRPTASKASVEGLALAPVSHFMGEKCSVCLLAFEQRDKVTILDCKHLFHQECISTWLLTRRRSCPLCGDEALPACHEST
jgi:hypothetical protein